MNKEESKETKVLREITEVLKKYGTPDEKEILEELSTGNLNNKASDKVMKKLIHEQHKQTIE